MRSVARWAVAAALVSLGACSGPDQSTPTTRGNGVVEVTAPVTIDGVDTTPPDDPAPTGVLQGTIDPANAAFCERMIAYQDSTSGTLEIARKTTTWSRKSVSAEPGQNRGYYPQLFKFDGKWWASDVVYDRNADALTTLRFTDLTAQQPYPPSLPRLQP